MTIAVSVRGLAMQYGRRLVFRELSFDLAAGQAAGVVGPNGSGKTTLLRALAGCLTPQAGEIRINGLTPRDAISNDPRSLASTTPTYCPVGPTTSNSKRDE